jgi:hypothetical protein
LAVRFLIFLIANCLSKGLDLRRTRLKSSQSGRAEITRIRSRVARKIHAASADIILVFRDLP